MRYNGCAIYGPAGKLLIIEHWLGCRRILFIPGCIGRGKAVQISIQGASSASDGIISVSAVTDRQNAPLALASPRRRMHMNERKFHSCSLSARIVRHLRIRPGCCPVLNRIAKLCIICEMRHAGICFDLA
jgi:hypothetical protein